ncbi:hypothetical protein CEXT_184181 [Caerostris extrusa]|uniref:Uncharacterized protein n=1 Tax=Caerostris extrusa TaxID=172846 RepID=A0AAV4RZR3_CAEEX|nr:hypothetical protein CEXT_184181 [Caerostris extrusa]
MEQYPNTTIPEREPTFKSESCNSSLYLSPFSLAGSVNPEAVNAGWALPSTVWFSRLDDPLLQWVGLLPALHASVLCIWGRGWCSGEKHSGVGGREVVSRAKSAYPDSLILELSGYTEGGLDSWLGFCRHQHLVIGIVEGSPPRWFTTLFQLNSERTPPTVVSKGSMPSFSFFKPTEKTYWTQVLRRTFCQAKGVSGCIWVKIIKGPVVLIECFYRPPFITPPKPLGGVISHGQHAKIVPFSLVLSAASSRTCFAVFTRGTPPPPYHPSLNSKSTHP